MIDDDRTDPPYHLQRLEMRPCCCGTVVIVSRTCFSVRQRDTVRPRQSVGVSVCVCARERVSPITV